MYLQLRVSSKAEPQMGFHDRLPFPQPNKSNFNYTLVGKHANGEDDLLILLGSIIDNIDTSWILLAHDNSFSSNLRESLRT